MAVSQQQQQNSLQPHTQYDANTLISTSSALGLRGRIREDKKNGGSGGVGASSSAATKSSVCSGSGMYTGTWFSGTYSGETWWPHQTTVWQPLDRILRVEYSYIVPQSEQTKGNGKIS
ncbi:hypothetical protein Tco_0012325 [Tanacetum coccineum]